MPTFKGEFEPKLKLAILSICLHAPFRIRAKPG